MTTRRAFPKAAASLPVIAAVGTRTKIEQLDQLVDGLNVTLTEDERKAVEEVYVPHPVLGTEP